MPSIVLYHSPTPVSTLSALIAVGDFNHVTMAKTLPNFIYYVSCPTREERTMDLTYANFKVAYNSLPLPPLGRSDHNLVHPNPCYHVLCGKTPAYDHKDSEKIAGAGL